MQKAHYRILGKYGIFPIITIAFTCPLIWLLCIPPTPSQSAVTEYEEKQLQKAHKLIEWFRSEFGEVPTSLTEIRAYSRYVGIDLSSYDLFGKPLQYLRLDSDHFMLRSFGTDGHQNALLDEEDHGLISWSALNHPGPIQKFVAEPVHTPYAPALLLGSNSPNRQWFAKLFVSRRDGARHLLVNHRQRQKLFMVAHHDMIEEFIWLPNGYQIVYTAAGSDRYSDGVYLWDLIQDRTTDLLETSNSQSSALTIAKSNKKLWLSLNGVNAEHNSVYFHMMPHTHTPLDPRQFYSAKTLYEVKVPLTKGVPSIRQAFRNPPEPKQIWRPSLTFQQDWLTAPKTLPQAQANFLSLPLQGDIEQTIGAWQDFCSNASNDASLPYCLWILSALFNDAYRITKEAPGDVGLKLKELAAEMAYATMKYELSPTYLRAIANYMFERLMTDEVVPMQISLMSQPANAPSK